MSEKYGKCRICKGKGYLLIKPDDQPGERECGLCDGTGFDGGGDRYWEKESQRERDINPVFVADWKKSL